MNTSPTYFAPAERAPVDVVLRQRDSLESSNTIRLLDAVPQILMVLNGHRQLVYCNKSLLQTLGLESAEPILGQRPGEVLDCIHASKGPGGCGTSEFCSQCGAVRAILAGLQGYREIQECHLLRMSEGNTEAMDLSVCASPFDLNGERFTVFAVTDISHEKRRHALERTFFHDILNRTGGLSGLLDLLTESAPEAIRPDLDLAHSQFKYFVDEILAHKEIMAAENNELKPQFAQLDGGEVLKAAAASYFLHEVARDRRILVEPAPGDLGLRTDFNLLCRVLGNMLKNALEACKPGETVTIFCRPDGDNVNFAVHNPGAMAREVQLQIFKRSFSTKDSDRGLGTFSMKLLTERYLGGQVSFTSNLEQGTTFTVSLPRTPSASPA